MNPTRLWDIYESETLAVRRSLGTDEVREELRRGKITGQDLIRPAGSEAPWRRIAGFPLEELAEPESARPVAPAKPANAAVPIVDEDLLNPDAEIDLDPDSGENGPVETARPVTRQEAAPSIELQALQWLMEDDEKPKEAPKKEEPRGRAAKPSRSSATPRSADREPSILEPSVELKLEAAGAGVPDLHFDDEEGGEEGEGDFTLSRSRVEHVEEMDLAAMVDIAFQLVLFFMVTASVTMIKSMELPKPTETAKPAAASAPGVGTRNRNEVEEEFIVVKISSDGEFLVEDDPVPADRLIERLRSVRNESGKTGMILRAENRTKHRLAVAAYDAANEIGLRIAIERETGEP